MKKNLSYIDSVHRDGRIWNICVMILLLAFPVAVAAIFGVLPDWNALLVGLVATAPMYWAVGAIETVTYVPMLGAGGSYLSFVTGNISNLKLPCALNALEQNGVSANSEEGEIISTIAIATSSIVTTVIIIIGVILIVFALLVIFVVLLQEGRQANVGVISGAADTFLDKGAAKTWEMRLAKWTKVIAIAFFVLVFAGMMITKFLQLPMRLFPEMSKWKPRTRKTLAPLRLSSMIILVVVRMSSVWIPTRYASKSMKGCSLT